MSKHKKKRVGIVDDDDVIVEVLTLILEDAGYETISTTDGKEVSRLLKPPLDLLLLDIWMSGTDGRGVCKALKAKKATKNLPIIMISANRDTQVIAQGAGADDFITKPFEMNDLLAKIEKYIGSAN